jgi:tetratricopeptide (TPR) repeat protein
MRLSVRSLSRSVIIVTAVSAALFVAGSAGAQETTTPLAAEATTDAGEVPEITEAVLEEATQKGEDALKAGDYEAALKIYNDLIKAGVANQTTADQDVLALALQAQARGFLGRGRALTGLKEYDAALEDFRFITENIDPNSIAVLIASGQLQLEKNDAELALSDFQKAVKAERGNVEAQLGFGKALVMLNRVDEAIAPLTRVIAADPQNAEAYRYRGNANAGLFKLEKAVEDLQNSIRLNPEDYEAYFTLGVVYLRAEEYQPAVDQLAKAVEHYKPKPGQEDVPYVQGYITLISAYTELGKHEKDEAARKAAYQAAINEANKLLELLGEKNPLYAQFRAAALHGRGVAERMLGEYGTAIRSFSQAIELSPESGEIYFRRGICFHMLGEDRMAISDFVRASHMSFDDPRCNLWAGFTYAKLGEYHNAVREYGDAIAVSDRYTPAYANRALAYWMLGEYDKAIADINEAIRLDPTNAEYYYKRGRAFERLNDHKKASESYASALEFDSKHTDAHRHMATVQQALGRSELAAQYRQRADELDAAAKK